MHQQKNLLMNFVTSLPTSTYWKEDSYNSIQVIVDYLTKMDHYKSVKITFNAPGLAEVIINMVICYHGLLDLIITDKSLFFTSKFWSLLYYFLNIKQRLSTTFHRETNGQTKRQNSMMKAYLQGFVNFEQKD